MGVMWARKFSGWERAAMMMIELMSGLNVFDYF